MSLNYSINKSITEILPGLLESMLLILMSLKAYYLHLASKRDLALDLRYFFFTELIFSKCVLYIYFVDKYKYFGY